MKISCTNPDDWNHLMNAYAVIKEKGIASVKLTQAILQLNKEAVYEEIMEIFKWMEWSNTKKQQENE